MNEKQMEILIEAIEDYIHLHEEEEDEYFAKQDLFSGKFVRSYLENLGGDALENAGESREFDYTEEEIQRMTKTVNRDRFEASNYAASMKALIRAISKIVETAEEDGKPYVIKDGREDWDWANLQDSIRNRYYNAWEDDCNVEESDPEEYGVWEDHVVRLKNGYYYDVTPIYWIGEREDA